MKALFASFVVSILGIAALASAKEMRREALRQAEESIARAFEPLTPQRRREMTKEHLLEAAAIVFARDGFHGASLDDIAALAGFTKGAVYSNFASKEDLFFAVYERRVEWVLTHTVPRLHQVGPQQMEFLEFCEREILSNFAPRPRAKRIPGHAHKLR